MLDHLVPCTYPLRAEQMQQQPCRKKTASRHSLTSPLVSSAARPPAGHNLVVDGEQRHHPGQAGECKCAIHTHTHTLDMQMCHHIQRHGSCLQVLLGDLGAGKTSIVVRFAKGLYYECQARTTTSCDRDVLRYLWFGFPGLVFVYILTCYN
jgi:hypothetical protein